MHGYDVLVGKTLLELIIAQSTGVLDIYLGAGLNNPVSLVSSSSHKMGQTTKRFGVPLQ